DGDGIADDADVCPGQDDTIDVDNDTIPDCNDPLIDTDNDGIADDADACPGQDDTIDVDNDTIPDCNDPLIDTDNDGIADDRDLCPDTVLPDQPRRRLGFFRLAAQPDGTFDAGWRRLDGRFTLEDTRGCSGAQIIDELGLGRRHQKFGISFGALKYWIRHVA
ncbi:MAG: thrombospondin type 3 repeat-containing protein, partial [Actinomycetota bacterium]